jgi:hypothetical protein
VARLIARASGLEVDKLRYGPEADHDGRSHRGQRGEEGGLLGIS